MPTLPKMKFHPAVKKHFSVRALVSLLMLVVDYEVPVDCNTADVFNAWVKVIQTQWSTWHRETARNWAQDRRLIASDHFVDKPHPRPKCIDSLPYRKEFTMKEMSDAVAMLEANHVPPAPNGHYYIKYGHEQRKTVRELMEQRVIRAVKELPCFEQSILRGAFRILEGHGPEFDDVRTELIGMAFDLANGAGNVDMYSLSNYARTAFNERSIAPVLSTFAQTQTDITDETNRLREVLIEKNRKYGDSALNPVHIFSKEPAHVQLKQQIDHKLARIARGDESTEDEDVTQDLIGYLVLYRIALRRWNAGEGNKVKSC
jgi:hypothetical protein